MLCPMATVAFVRPRWAAALLRRAGRLFGGGGTPNRRDPRGAHPRAALALARARVGAGAEARPRGQTGGAGEAVHGVPARGPQPLRPLAADTGDGRGHGARGRAHALRARGTHPRGWDRGARPPGRAVLPSSGADQWCWPMWNRLRRPLPATPWRWRRQRTWRYCSHRSGVIVRIAVAFRRETRPAATAASPSAQR
jgi:hypothetical protein